MSIKVAKWATIWKKYLSLALLSIAYKVGTNCAGDIGGTNGNSRQRQNNHIAGVSCIHALCKLLIEKGVITQEEFMDKVKAERAMYQFQKVR